MLAWPLPSRWLLRPQAPRRLAIARPRRARPNSNRTRRTSPYQPHPAKQAPPGLRPITTMLHRCGWSDSDAPSWSFAGPDPGPSGEAGVTRAAGGAYGNGKRVTRARRRDACGLITDACKECARVSQPDIGSAREKGCGASVTSGASGPRPASPGCLTIRKIRHTGTLSEFRKPGRGCGWGLRDWRGESGRDWRPKGGGNQRALRIKTPWRLDV